MRKFALVFAPLLLAASAASATVGGPTLCEVLGLDPAARRVYFTLTSWDESGGPERIFYYDLGSATPAKPVPLASPARAAGADPGAARAAEIAALRKRLRPLPEAGPWSSFVPHTAWEVLDSVRCESGLRPRWVATVMSGADGDGRRPRMTSLDPSPHAVRELRRYRLPLEGRWLAVWSAELDPWEGGYEIQLPVMLGEHRGRPDPVTPEAYADPR